MVAWTCNSSDGDKGGKRWVPSWDFLASLVYPMSYRPMSNVFSKRMMWMEPEEWHVRLVSGLHMHTHVQTHPTYVNSSWLLSYQFASFCLLFMFYVERQRTQRQVFVTRNTCLPQICPNNPDFDFLFWIQIRTLLTILLDLCGGGQSCYISWLLHSRNDHGRLSIAASHKKGSPIN